MTDLTPAEVSDLRTTRAAGTQGEWFVDRTVALGANGIYRKYEPGDPGEGLTMICRAGYSTFITPKEQRDADMALIAAAVNALPKLLDAVEERDRLESRVRDLGGDDAYQGLSDRLAISETGRLDWESKCKAAEEERDRLQAECDWLQNALFAGEAEAGVKP